MDEVPDVARGPKKGLGISVAVKGTTPPGGIAPRIVDKRLTAMARPRRRLWDHRVRTQQTIQLGRPMLNSFNNARSRP
jgi:hypothetical protein